ncbi:hypothetical protein ACI2L1_29620 [Streptomyces sp. NPDC019531]|uniref:hypothetical protein n=1 Tax=Streptomyces sp. NPDC019531 TaxID=3365062 RepID=UPI0038504549
MPGARRPWRWGHRGWQTVAAADGERPLPGYARGALSVRPDCPPALRTQFGSHPKATPSSPTGSGRPVSWPVPARTRPRERLDDREEAWAVPAKLLDTFHGTAPELIMTAGAIA